MVSCTGTRDAVNQITGEFSETKVVVKQPDIGKIVTLLDTAIKITDCEMVADESNTKHNPPIFFDGSTMYIYKFPAFTAIAGRPDEEAKAYLAKYIADTTEYSYEIEVYADPTSTQPSEIITLKGLNGERVNFYQLFKSNDLLILFGKENIEGEWLPHCYEFSMDGSLLNRSLLSGVPQLADFFPVGDVIYYCDPDSGRFNFENTVYDLYCYDRATEESTIADEHGVILLFESAGTLYCLTQGDTSSDVILSSVTADGFTEIHTFPSPLSGISGAEYDAKSQILYVSDYQNLYAVHADDNTPRKILFSGDKYIYPEGITDDWILIRNGGYAITAYHKPEEKISLEDGQEVLRVFCPESVWSGQMKDDLPRTMNLNDYNLFAQGITIKDTMEYSHTLAKKLLSGDTDFDIFYVSTEMSDLLKGRYYENLSRYPIINSYFSRMLPGAADLCKVDGISALVPSSLITYCMVADTSAAALNPQSLRTWDDILEFRKDMKLSDDECIMAAYRSENLLCSTFELLITNYMRDIIDYEQAKSDLDKLYSMVMEFESDPFFDVTKEDGFRKAFLYERQNKGRLTRLAENETAIPLPGMMDEYKQNWSGTFWAINPNSKNKELAAAYLAYFIEDSLSRPGGVCDLYYIKSSSETENYAGTNNEMFELFCEQLKNGVLAYELPDFIGYFNRQFADIKSGKLTREEAAEDLLRWMHMLKYE